MIALLDENPGIMMQRRCDVKWEECCKDGNPDKPTHQAFGDYLHNMSVNMLGGRFKPENVAWQQINKGKKDWDGRTNIKLRHYKDDFKPHPYKHALYIDSRFLHKCTIDVPYIVTDKKLKKRMGRAIAIAFKDKEQISEEQIKVHIVVNHSPSNLNYWHVEISQEVRGDKETIEINNSKSVWRQKILDAFKEYLVDHATLRRPDYIPAIPERHYLK